tara:strand:+ start:850 stop:1089 length:240 start_codon:yes stop_codon:yes gene_type:complete
MTKNFIVTPENPEGVLVDKTPEEITEQENRKAEHQQLLADKANAEAEAQAKEDLKASAKQKLMNGEALTEDEANVMVGL